MYIVQWLNVLFLTLTVAWVRDLPQNKQTNKAQLGKGLKSNYTVEKPCKYYPGQLTNINILGDKACQQDTP